MALRERWGGLYAFLPGFSTRKAAAPSHRPLNQLDIGNALDRFEGAPHSGRTSRRFGDGELDLPGRVAKAQGYHHPAPFLPARRLSGREPAFDSIERLRRRDGDLQHGRRLRRRGVKTANALACEADIAIPIFCGRRQK